MKRILLIGLVGSMVLGACQKAVDPEKLSKVESLQSRIDSSDIAFNKLDSARAVGTAMQYTKNVAYIKEDYRDTIGLEIARFIDEYYSLRKAMKLINTTYAKTGHEIRTTKQRLEDLEHDLTNGLIENEQFQQYYQLESNNVSLIDEQLSDLIYAIETVQPMYDDMNPKVDSLINESKRKAGMTEAAE